MRMGKKYPTLMLKSHESALPIDIAGFFTFSGNKSDVRMTKNKGPAEFSKAKRKSITRKMTAKVRAPDPSGHARKLMPEKNKEANMTWSPHLINLTVPYFLTKWNERITDTRFHTPMHKNVTSR